MATLAELEAEFARRQGAAGSQQSAPAASLEALEAEAVKRGMIEAPQSTLVGDIEQVASLASGALAAPLSGIAGIAQTLNPFAEEGAGARAVQSTQEALTFQPRTEAGRSDLAITGGALSGIPDIGKAMGDFTMELTGSPIASTIAASTPTAIGEALGIGALRRLRPGTKLLTPAGRPTLALEKVLDKQGLVFDNLKPETKALIPVVAEKRLLPGGGKAEIAGAAENVLIEHIKAGGSDASLATVKVANNRIAPDAIGAEAVRQGYDPGVVQQVKTSSPATKAGMKKMLDVMRRVKSDKRVAQDIIPSDIIGDSFSTRIKHIRDKADTARKELNVIAEEQLPGLKVDGSKVITALEKSLDDLDIKVTNGPDGIPVPTFKGSLISKDKTSQGIIMDVIDLMAEGGKPDAIRMHKLKKQFDRIIDFRKKDGGGLTDAGRDVMKDVRVSLNESIRDVSPDYARVNDVLHKSLTGLDDFQSAVGSTIDIFGKGSNKAIGQDLRGLMSKRKSRVKLENSVDNIETIAAELGGKFDDSIKDLVDFGLELDSRHGSVQKAGFSSQIQDAISGGPEEVIKKKLIEKAASGLEGLRGINDPSAFRAMEGVLNR